MTEPISDPKALDAIVESEGLERSMSLSNYLKQLLLDLWSWGENFKSKRPYGYSDWQFDAYKALIVGGFISGSIDQYGYVENLDPQEADRYILDLIKNHLFVKGETNE